MIYFYGYDHADFPGIETERFCVVEFAAAV
jgi:hypothetical protein